MRQRVKSFLAIEYEIFLVLFLYLLNQTPVFDWKKVIFFAVILFIADSISVLNVIGKDIAISICLPVLIPVMAIRGPFEVGLIAMLGASGLIRFYKREWYKNIFNMTATFIAAATGVLVFQLVQTYLAKFYLSLLIGSLIYYIINEGLVLLVVWLSSDEEDINRYLLTYIYHDFKIFILLYALGILFYYFQIYSNIFITIFSIALIYVLKDLVFSWVQHQNSLAQIVESFLKVIDSKDYYTVGHCQRVAEYVSILCMEMKLSINKTDLIVNMAKIHDIGKIYLDDQILKSLTHLSREDYQVMKKHSYFGYELLQDIDIMKKDLKMILYHHENYNGTGYPDGIDGEEIPLGARIIRICEAFDVMMTGRIYKPALKKEEIITELENCSGRQFDPELAELMLKLIRSGRFDNYLDKVKGKNFFERLRLKFVTTEEPEVRSQDSE